MPANKKLLPLLAIAFTVAVVATGLLYGLIAGNGSDSAPAKAGNGKQRAWHIATKELKPGTVLTGADIALSYGDTPPQDSLPETETLIGRTLLKQVGNGVALTRGMLLRESREEARNGIPAGMRAVTVHVADSSGVVSLVEPGDKVDMLLIAQRNGEESQRELRTVLQATEVISVLPADINGDHAGKPVMTVLARPQDAERLSLADALGSVRVLLRNRKDDGQWGTGLVTVGNLLDGRATPTVIERPQQSHETALVSSAPPTTGKEPAKELKEWNGPRYVVHLVRESGNNGGELRVQPLPTSFALDATAQETLSRQALSAGPRQEYMLRAAKTASLRLVLQAQAMNGTQSTWTIQPEATCERPEGVATRRIETKVQLMNGQGFLVRGLFSGEESSAFLRRVYPGRAAQAGSLALVVLPEKVLSEKTAPLQATPLQATRRPAHAGE
jgi:Flp pilus assembly protein CpaB